MDCSYEAVRFMVVEPFVEENKENHPVRHIRMMSEPQQLASTTGLIGELSHRLDGRDYCESDSTTQDDEDEYPRLSRRERSARYTVVLWLDGNN